MAIVHRKTKCGKSRYMVRVFDELGNYYPSKTFKTRKEAERYDRQLKEKKEKREHALSTTVRNVSVGLYFEEWLDLRRKDLSKGWHTKIVQLSKDHILGEIGFLKLQEVRPPHVGKLLAKMQGKGLSAQTRVHIFNILNRAFRDAIEYFGYLGHTPVLKQDRPKVHRVERAYLTPEQSWTLLEHCRDHYLGPAIWLAILSGLRPSEVQALRWKAVNFKKGQILICAAFKRSIGVIEPYPKQKDWALVPLPGVLAAYLQESKKPRFPQGFVASAYAGGMLDYSKFYRGLRQLCDGANVPRVSPHELRHSCTEIWFRHGAKLEDVRRLLGHKSAETTQRYVHKTDDRLIHLASEIRAQM